MMSFLALEILTWTLIVGFNVTVSLVIIFPRFPR